MMDIEKLAREAGFRVFDGKFVAADGGVSGDADLSLRRFAALVAEEAGDVELAKQIRAMFLRDCRKRAADLAESAEAASKLLQHSSVSLTSKHYRTRADQLRPVR